MQLTQDMQRVELKTMIERVFDMFEIKATILAIEFRDGVWNWAIQNRTGQEMYGQVTEFSDYHPGAVALQVAGAIAIGLHPANRVIVEIIDGYRDNLRWLENGQPDLKRNSILEIILRRSLDGLISMGIKKSSARSYILNLINMDKNIEEKYAAKQQKAKKE